MNYYHNFLRLKATDLHPQILVNDLKKLPMVPALKSRQDKFLEIVNKIFAITKDSDYLENSSKQAKVRDYEKQIDQLVYKLYGLTLDEIKIVENS